MTEHYCDFQVGDKVVYLGAPAGFVPKPPVRDWQRDTFIPTAGTIYTVRSIGPHKFCVGVRIGIRLQEGMRYPSSPHHLWRDAPFGASGFRRVVDTTKQFEALKRLIIDAAQKVPA